MAGSASVLCLLSMTVILAVGATTLTVMFAKQAVLKRAVEVEQAFLAAEAGVDLALSEVRSGNDHDGDGLGVVSGAVGRGTFETALDPEYSGPRNYTIVATGRVGAVIRSIEVEIGQVSTRAGFLADGAIDLRGGYVDSYDSALGSYASQVSGKFASDDVVIRSNANIVLQGSASVFGDATPGPTGTVTGGAAVTGSTAPAAGTATMDSYTYAPPIASMGALSSSKVFTSGQYRYSTFAMGGGKTATFNGNVELWVDGNFSIAGSGQALLTPGSQLTIHHGAGTFTIGGNGVINQDQQPSNITLSSATTGAMTISGTGDFFGKVHAPKADFVLRGNGAFYGSATVKTMTLSGSMSMHYDKALGSGSAVQVRLQRPLGSTARKS